MKNLLFLLTNDDGIISPGLHALIETIMPLGEIIIAAPTRQQTAMGRSISGDQESAFVSTTIEIDNKKIKAYHCNCSPALTVTHALNVLCKSRKPDLVISGINYGENLGTNVTHSGTIGAALEAASFNIPALAVSMQTEIENHKKYNSIDWKAARFFTQLFAKKLLNSKLPKDVDFLKVDVPFGATENTKWKMTRISRLPYYTTSIKSPQLSSKISEADLQIIDDINSIEPDSDIYAVMIDKVVSVSPLSIDLTSRIDLKEFRNKLFNK
jgi:5'-nucleotidase